MKLRIIGGIYKNRSIKLNKKGNIRPTLIRSRKIVFDTVIARVPQKFSFLDVFAGSGIMGIEALSRKAENVVFFDNNKFTINYINENLKSMEKIPGLYSTICTNVFKPPEGRPMNVVFLDPPYDKYFIIPDVLDKLIEKNWIDTETIVIIEYFSKNKVTLDSRFILFKDTKISKSILQFFIYDKNNIL